MLNSQELRRELDSLLNRKRSETDKRRNADKELSVIDKRIKEVDALLALSLPIIPQISDHALLRYIERKYNLDIETLKAEIMPNEPNILRSIQTLGDGKYPIGDSHRVVIKGNTVTTVLPLND